MIDFTQYVKGGFKVSGLGERLRQQRINLGLTLQEVEYQTKIRIFYLEAIENEDYKSLPGKVYIMGFLRSYSRLLKMDADEIIDEFNASWPDADNQDNVATYVKEASFREKKAPKVSFNYNKLLRFSVIVLAVAVLLSVNHFWDRPIPTPPPEGPMVNLPNDNNGEEIEEEPNGDQEPVYTGVNIEIIPVRGDCWLTVTIDNEVVFSGMLFHGQEGVAFQSENEIQARFGSAGAVDIIFNGELLEPIGNVGQVLDWIFTVEDLDEVEIPEEDEDLEE